MQSKLHLPLYKLFFLFLCSLLATQLFANPQDSQENKVEISEERAEGITEFMNQFFQDFYEGRTIGEDLVIELSEPVRLVDRSSLKFQNWDFYSMSWRTQDPTSKLNSFPRFRFVLAVNPEKKYYPILDSGGAEDQFVKLWNENFQKIEKSEDVREFFNLFNEIRGLPDSKGKIVRGEGSGGYKFVQEKREKKIETVGGNIEEKIYKNYWELFLDAEGLVKEIELKRTN